MKVLVGSKNKGKIEGAKQAFEEYFDNVEIEGIDVLSGVSDQPFDDEIIKGARGRIKALKEYAKNNDIDVDYFVATEAGIERKDNVWIDINLACIESKDGEESVGISQGFQIPNKYIDEIKFKDLGSLMDRLFNGKDLSKSNGGINYLTKNKISRINLTKNAYMMALIKFINEDIWRD